MGLFKKLKKAVQHPVVTVKKVASTVASNPIRATTAIASGGLSEIARKAPIIGNTVKELQAVASETYLGLANVYTGGLASAAQTATLELTAPQETEDMGLNIGNLIGGLGQAASNLGGFSQNPYLQTAGVIATSFGGAYGGQVSMPAQTGMPDYGGAQPILVGSSGVPAVRSRSMITQDIADAGGKLLQRLGLRYGNSVSSFSSVLKRALSSIGSLARRTPSGTIVQLLVGLGLTAGEAYLLSAYSAQRKKGRRMNPANSKALRRAARRIKGFHKLCTHTDVLRSRGRSVSRARCGSCKKSPCKC